MKRFFVEDIDIDSALVRISGAEFAHLKKVLRLKAGAAVALFNGSGLELTGVIESIGKDMAVVRVGGRFTNRRESPLEITLLQGLVKKDKPEFIIQKATELGAKEVYFYSTSRTVPVISGGRSEDKIPRWRKISVEAAKQCGRTILPRISIVKDLKDALGLRRDALKLLFWEGEGVRSVKDVIKTHLTLPAGKGLVVLVGPEGGFSEEDVKTAVAEGFIPVGLGPRILRAETAAVAALSILQYELGDLN